jgi:ABC-type dipeptide/oligopeptide/nickel transport system ATPase subunit
MENDFPEIPSGSVVTIVGKRMCGKTTLAATLVTHLAPAQVWVLQPGAVQANNMKEYAGAKTVTAEEALSSMPQQKNTVLVIEDAFEPAQFEPVQELARKVGVTQIRTVQYHKAIKEDTTHCAVMNASPTNCDMVFNRLADLSLGEFRERTPGRAFSASWFVKERNEQK